MGLNAVLTVVGMGVIQNGTPLGAVLIRLLIVIVVVTGSKVLDQCKAQVVRQKVRLVVK